MAPQPRACVPFLSPLRNLYLKNTRDQMVSALTTKKKRQLCDAIQVLVTLARQQESKTKGAPQTSVSCGLESVSCALS